MLRTEWRNLLRNKIMLLVIIAVIVIPAIYTSLFLGSMWDPYGNLNKLPVAIVNQDKPLEYQGQQMNLGSKMVENLKKNASLDFHVVDADAAKAGLEKGTYYMVITIPENFSANATTLTKENVRKMEIFYETNPGTNYIASKMSNTAMAKIESSLCKQVTKTYAEEMLQQLTQAGDGLSQAAIGAEALENGEKEISTGNQTMAENLKLLADSSLSFVNGNETLIEGLQQYVNGVDTVNQGIAALESGAVELKDGMTQLQGKMPELESGVNTLAQGSNQLMQSTTVLEQGSRDLESGAQQLDEQMGALCQGLESLQSQTKDLPERAQMLNSGMDMVSGGVVQFQQELAGLQAEIDLFVQQGNGSPDVNMKLQEFSQRLNMLSVIAEETENGLVQLKDGTEYLEESAPELTAGIQNAYAGSVKLKTQGTAVLKESCSQMASGISEVNNGTVQLDTGIKNLAGEVPNLKNGVEQLSAGSVKLSAGASALYDGSQKLVSESNKLLDGGLELKNGAYQLNKGADSLYLGSITLGNGIARLEQGSQSLHTALADGAEQFNGLDNKDNMTEMFAAPVVTNETQITTVENNGHAMAPYMMSVALWVGCIAFCLMYPLTSYCGELKSGIAWWGGKASVLYAIAILQAIVMVFILYICDGFRPVEMAKNIGIACLASVTFMAIMYFFTSTLGKVGSFFMLIFMVVQLAGSVGTYPLELSGSFVPYLHGWVPFTYTVTAFRSTIAGGESIISSVIFLMILFLLFTGLTMMEFHIRARKLQKGTATLNQWLEEKGLA